MAHLRHPHRTLHGPEVRIGQRNIDRLQRQRVAHLPPVGGDHIGGGRQPGGAAELRHHLAAGITLLGAARIFRIGQHSFQLLAEQDRLVERPGAVGIERNARLWKALRQRRHRFRLFAAAQHAALEFEVVKAVLVVRRLGQPHHRVRRQRLFVAQAIPVAGLIFLALVGERRLFTVADVEQVAEHLNAVALLSIAQQRGDVDLQMLAQQVEQRRLNAGDHVNGGAQIKGLAAAPR